MVLTVHCQPCRDKHLAVERHLQCLERFLDKHWTVAKEIFQQVTTVGGIEEILRIVVDCSHRYQADRTRGLRIDRILRNHTVQHLRGWSWVELLLRTLAVRIHYLHTRDIRRIQAMVDWILDSIGVVVLAGRFLHRRLPAPYQNNQADHILRTLVDRNFHILDCRTRPVLFDRIHRIAVEYSHHTRGNRTIQAQVDRYFVDQSLADRTVKFPMDYTSVDWSLRNLAARIHQIVMDCNLHILDYRTRPVLFDQSHRIPGNQRSPLPVDRYFVEQNFADRMVRFQRDCRSVDWSLRNLTDRPHRIVVDCNFHSLGNRKTQVLVDQSSTDRIHRTLVDRNHRIQGNQRRPLLVDRCLVGRSLRNLADRTHHRVASHNRRETENRTTRDQVAQTHSIHRTDRRQPLRRRKRRSMSAG